MLQGSFLRILTRADSRERSRQSPLPNRLSRQIRVVHNPTEVSSDRQLWQKQVENYSIWQNLRGWLHLLRKRGWHRSIRQWPRWLRLASSSSPRSWIYRTGSELFFQLPAMLFNPDQTVQPRLRELFDALPESQCPRQVGDWRHLAAEIARNYNEFVVATRS